MSISRRSVLSSATGAAVALPTLAVAALPAVAEPSPSFSPEYWECERRWIDLEQLKLSQAAVHATEAEWDAQGETTDRYREAKDALLRRPVRNLFDVVALMRTDAWQAGNFVRVRYQSGDQGTALKAAEMLAGTGTWDVPPELVRLEAEMQGKWDAFYKSRPLRDGPGSNIDGDEEET